MAQPYKNAMFVLVGLLVVLILVNIFILMPRTRMEPAQPVVAVSGEPPGTSTRDNIVSVDTLQAIKESRTGEEHVLYSEEEFSRNPFFWPTEKTVAKKITQKERVAPIKPQLSMIIIGEQQKQALLDDVFVTEGGTFHGYRVKRITNRQVILEGDLGDIRITLAAGRKGDQIKQGTSEIGIIER